MEWKWFPMKENVDDDATRNTAHIEVSSISRWFTRPEFLIRGQYEWPKEPSKLDFSEDTKRESSIDFLDTADPHDGVGAALENFSQDSRLLTQNEKIQPTSKLIEVSPKIGDDGLLRMNGRIRNGEISQTVREPIILRRSNRFVRILIEHHFRKVGHIGQERVVNDLRSKYWIKKLRATVTAVCSQCQTCKNCKIKPQTPEMASLPDIRTETFIKPLTNTGVDYFGPMEPCQISLRLCNNAQTNNAQQLLPLRSFFGEIIRALQAAVKFARGKLNLNG
ncbi:uncharacterized protein LOC117173586 [Belonocnema kinseyi]|uniref:uncharacterized protein LOC117173586 n=1 Tax=Belonocnema kinseyi TaxID=2817044 RepID=UPI00143D55FF|nr:uncharacterized protein LOC117173586 [Belonocnema kinseyi]